VALDRALPGAVADEGAARGVLVEFGARLLDLGIDRVQLAAQGAEVLALLGVLAARAGAAAGLGGVGGLVLVFGGAQIDLGLAQARAQLIEPPACAGDRLGVLGDVAAQLRWRPRYRSRMTKRFGLRDGRFGGGARVLGAVRGAALRWRRSSTSG
jgi:hypothetical protein